MGLRPSKPVVTRGVAQERLLRTYGLSAEHVEAFFWVLARRQAHTNLSLASPETLSLESSQVITSPMDPASNSDVNPTTLVENNLTKKSLTVDVIAANSSDMGTPLNVGPVEIDATSTINVNNSITPRTSDSTAITGIEAEAGSLDNINSNGLLSTVQMNTPGEAEMQMTRSPSLQDMELSSTTSWSTEAMASLDNSGPVKDGVTGLAVPPSLDYPSTAQADPSMPPPRRKHSRSGANSMNINPSSLSPFSGHGSSGGNGENGSSGGGANGSNSSPHTRSFSAGSALARNGSARQLSQAQGSAWRTRLDRVSPEAFREEVRAVEPFFRLGHVASDRLFEVLGSDGEGLTLDQFFCALYLFMCPREEETYRLLFNMFDLSGSNFIRKERFRVMASEVAKGNLDVLPESFDEDFATLVKIIGDTGMLLYDQNRDGKLSFDEWCQYARDDESISACLHAVPECKGATQAALVARIMACRHLLAIKSPNAEARKSSVEKRVESPKTASVINSTSNGLGLRIIPPIMSGQTNATHAGSALGADLSAKPSGSSPKSRGLRRKIIRS